MSNLENKIFTQLDNVAEKAGDFDKIKNGIDCQKKRSIKYKAFLVACAFVVLFVSIGIVLMLTQNNPNTVPPIIDNPDSTIPSPDNVKIVYKKPGENKYIVDSTVDAMEGDKIPEGMTIITRPNGYPENISDVLAYLLDQEADANTLFRIEMSYEPEDLYNSVKIDGLSFFDVYKEIITITWEKQLAQMVYTSLIETAVINTNIKMNGGSFLVTGPYEDETYEYPANENGFIGEYKKQITPLEYFRERWGLVFDRRAYSIINTDEKFKEYTLNGQSAKDFPILKEIAQWYYDNENNPQIPKSYIDNSHWEDNLAIENTASIEKYFPILKELGIEIRKMQIEEAKNIFSSHDLKYDENAILLYSNHFTVTLAKSEILHFAKENSNMFFHDLSIENEIKDIPKTINSELYLKMDELSDDDKIDINIIYSDCEILGYSKAVRSGQYGDNVISSPAGMIKFEALSKKYGDNVWTYGSTPIISNGLYEKISTEIGYSIGGIFYPVRFNAFIAPKMTLSKSEILNLAKQEDVLYIVLQKNIFYIDSDTPVELG